MYGTKLKIKRFYTFTMQVCRLSRRHHIVVTQMSHVPYSKIKLNKTITVSDQHSGIFIKKHRLIGNSLANLTSLNGCALLSVTNNERKYKDNVKKLL